jgi:hypothetical protein
MCTYILKECMCEMCGELIESRKTRRNTCVKAIYNVAGKKEYNTCPGKEKPRKTETTYDTWCDGCWEDQPDSTKVHFQSKQHKYNPGRAGYDMDEGGEAVTESGQGN